MLRVAWDLESLLHILPLRSINLAWCGISAVRVSIVQVFKSAFAFPLIERKDGVLAVRTGPCPSHHVSFISLKCLEDTKCFMSKAGVWVSYALFHWGWASAASQTNVMYTN